MAYYPFGPESAAIYTLTSPDGVVAVFNDPNDPNFAGYVTEVSGLDGAEVREAAQDLVQADGGSHGYFYYGRRPIILTGKILPTAANPRNYQVDRIERASNAMRGDATLSWKPSIRQENLVVNPNFELDNASWAVSASTHIAAATSIARSTAQFSTGSASGLVTGPSVASAGNWGARIPVGTVNAGQTYYGRIKVRSNIAGVTQAQLVLASAASAVSAATSTITTVTTGAWTEITASWTPTQTFTDAALHIRTPNTSATPGSLSFYVDDVLFSPQNVAAFVDGNTTNYYWQGNTNASTSGNFVEMYTSVRKQQPVRISGGFNKDFQLALVSEYAYLYSTGLKTATGTNITTLENRGSAISYPVVTITGSGTATQITVSGPDSIVFRTTGLTLASGETMSVDMLNHTATFTNNTGGRNGTSANRYIDFTTGGFPYLKPATTNTWTLANATSMTVSWRDTWV